MPIVRPARADDIDAFYELAELSGPGFTSLPVDRERLEETIASSVTTLSNPREMDDSDHFLLMLEDDDGRVRGCAAVKPKTGLKKPFFNYKILRVSQVSSVIGRRFDTDILMLVNEYAGCTEVGTLFLHPDARGGGNGTLLAKSRYLLIAAAPERFASNVVAELRGVVDEKGRSPFWEHLGVKFFNMTFGEADHLNAISDNQFILDLMPKYPIYLELLHPDARGVVGHVHPDGQAAMKLLEAEGFRYDRVVDIFDAGPLVSAPRNDIRTVRESRLFTVHIADDGQKLPHDAFVSTDVLNRFGVTRARAHIKGDRVTLTASDAERLKVSAGDQTRVWSEAL